MNNFNYTHALCYNVLHFSSVTPPRPLSRSPSSEILNSQSVWTIVYDQPVSLFLLLSRKRTMS